MSGENKSRSGTTSRKKGSYELSSLLRTLAEQAENGVVTTSNVTKDSIEVTNKSKSLDNLNKLNLGKDFPIFSMTDTPPEKKYKNKEEEDLNMKINDIEQQNENLMIKSKTLESEYQQLNDNLVPQYLEVKVLERSVENEQSFNDQLLSNIKKTEKR